MKLELFSLGAQDDDAPRVRHPLEEEMARAEAWDRWAIESCVERGGHWWWLDVVRAIEAPPELSLHCQVCPATHEELYPDGMDLLGGTIDLPFGGQMVINCGEVSGTWIAEWHGPVRARVDSWRLWTDYGYEYDAEFTVESL